MFFPPWGLFMLIKTFFFSPFMVEGESMLPTLASGEFFMVDRMTYRMTDPRRDDVAVFYLDGAPDYYYVKRIIGLPGDKIHLASDGVYLVDPQTGVKKKLSEPFVFPEKYHPAQFLSSENELGQDFTVPEGKYFVLGDNRQHSRDSRYFSDPFVPRADIVGRFGFEVTLPPGLLGVSFSPMASVSQQSTSGSQQTVVLPQYNPTGLVNIQLANGGQASFKVEAAVTTFEREQGLMHRTSMADDHGMIFLFENPQPLTFWMKNTLIPLDMLFIDENWKVVHIQKMAEPCKVDPCEFFASGLNAKYVLEINGGMSDKLGIAEGDTMTYKS